ncbi:MAG: maleylacetoacetate isomerase [Alphaproteobacteria bacterium]
MKLFDYWRSSAAFRMRIALNLKGLEFEREFIHLRRKDQISESYLAVNSQGLVPALVDDDGTVLTQSIAMIEYLDETHPEGARLMPGDAEGRARVRAISQAIACEIHPLNNLRVLRHLGQTFGIDDKTRNRDWYAHWIAVGMLGVEGLLANHPATGDFCHGDTPSLADICLVPQIFNAQRFGCDMSGYPTAMAINARCLALPAFRDALPDNQPDAE